MERRNQHKWMKGRRRWAGWLLALGLTGCANPVVFTTSSLAPEQDVLAYYQWLQNASAPALEQERSYLTAPATPNRVQQNVKLALLLSRDSNADVPQLQQAQQLLQLALADSAANPLALPVDYQVFATHWEMVLQLRLQLQSVQGERQRLDALAAAQTSGQAELQQRYDLLSAALASQQQANTALEQRMIQMQQQLEALIGIEQQLAEQERAAGNGAGR